MKIRFTLMTVLLFSVIAMAQKSNSAESDLWSRLKLDGRQTAVISNDNTNYVPPPQIPRLYRSKGIEAVVYPNYRPWPTTNSTQSEMSIDISPVNSNIIFCSANATNQPVTTVYGTGVYYTTNGGTNWAGADNPPFGGNSGDPAASFDASGNMYVGFIDAGSNDGGQGVAVSTNNGTTWSRYVVAPAPPGASDLLDKNHLVADKKAGSPYQNRVYAAWTDFISGNPNNYKLGFKYSTNNGTTWSTQVNISSSQTGYLHQGVNLQTGPQGQVYAAFAIYDASPVTNGEDAIGFNVSTDGGATWGTSSRLYSATNFGVRGNLTNKGSIRVSSFPSMAVDRSGGPNNGTIYVTWPQRGVAPAGSDPDIVLVKSTDGGATWSTPKRVNDDPLNNGKDQYYPWMTVDQATGHIYIAFYDSRNTTNDSAGVYLARSIDGGNTFENVRVSDRNFKPKTISGLASGYQGDYIGVAAHANTVYPYWMEDRTGIYQGWITKVTFGPIISHTALPNTENLTGPYTVGANISSSLALDPTKVRVFWGRNSGGAVTDSITMTSVAQDSFVANIPGNGQPGNYYYYIYAEDITGGFSTFPSGAPANKFMFVANIDSVLPVITHTAIGNQYRETWPASVNATVTDNIGVDSVLVEYKLKSSGLMRNFILSKGSNNSYAGTFNIDTSLIAVGDTLYYRIKAKDSGTLHNIAYLPASGYNSFVFINDTEFPVIAHTPLRNQPEIRWPAVVKATVTDNIGVNSVKVEYSIRNGVISGNFNLNSTGNNVYQGTFNVDTSQILTGDTVAYRVIAKDISNAGNIVYSPANGYHKFAIINTLGIVLVLNDDDALSNRISPYKGGDEVLGTPLGASATLIATTLTNAGYVVDQAPFATADSTTFGGYDVIALAAGPKTAAMFDNLPIRTAIVNYSLSGGKTFVEGGEVGWIYRYSSATSDKDPYFRRNILHDSSWVSDISTGLLRKRMPLHPIFNVPGYVPDSLSFNVTTYGARDAMRTVPNKAGIFKYAGWYPTYPDTAGIIGYSPTNDPNVLRNLYYSFSLSNMNDQQAAKNLVENGFNLLVGEGGVIPVELTSFTASVVNNDVQLIWETATEINNSGFDIERKEGAGSYAKVSFVKGTGNSIVPNTYTYTDKNMKSGIYTYRLKQIDFDGSFKYLPEVKADITLPTVYSLEQNYPNPFNPSSTIKYSVPASGMVNISVFNALGEKVATIINGMQDAGSYAVDFNASALGSGIYFYRMEAGEFVSVKKMMVLK